MSLAIKLFLGLLVLFNETLQHGPQSAPSTEAPGGGVAGNTNDIPLVAANSFAMGVFVFGWS